MKIKLFQFFKRNTIVKLFFSFVALSAIGYCAKNLIENFDSLLKLQWWNHPWLLLVHLSFLSLFFFIFSIGWTVALRACGQSFSVTEAVYCWLVANAGKYIPGKIFMFSGRLFLCSKIGVRQSACIWASALEHCFMLLASLPFIVPVLLQGYIPDAIFIYAFCFIVFVSLLLTVKPAFFVELINKMLVRMHREPLHIVLSSTNILLLVGIYFVAWTIYGLSGVILVNALEIQTKLSSVFIASVFVVSWMVGFFSFLTPGGIGVREATLVLLLKPVVAAPQSLALALLARATWTTIEIAGVGIGSWLIRGRIVNGKTQS
jgi:uncharacterized membrane protein YbhN (UPF0104 family)